MHILKIKDSGFRNLYGWDFPFFRHGLSKIVHHQSQENQTQTDQVGAPLWVKHKEPGSHKEDTDRDGNPFQKKAVPLES